MWINQGAGDAYVQTSNNVAQRWITEAALKLVRDEDCDVLILGNARIIWSEQAVRDVVGTHVTIINPVTAGIHMLAGLIHSGQQTSGAGIYG